MIYSKLFNAKDNEFISPEIDFSYLSKMQKLGITDKDYFTFISEITNGGFFFDKALHLYGACSNIEYHSLKAINEYIHHTYKELSHNLFFFGQDIFGNQFAFEETNIILFNIETAEREFIAQSYIKWLEAVFNDLEFLTGQSFSMAWTEKKQSPLLFNQRLCPKKPFVVGGEYEINNLYEQSYPLYLSNNANIARQVYYLPDGTDIELKITE